MYAEFNYMAPGSKHELFEIIGRYKEGKRIYAGGTDLLVLLRARKIDAKHLIDIKRIEEFGTITENDASITIGSAVTMTEIHSDPSVKRWLPALAGAVNSVGSVPIRNKATLAGNIQTASPAGDGMNAAWGLDANIVLTSECGERVVPLTEYITAPRKTVIADNEVIAKIVLPKREWTYQSFFKIGRRNALAISILNGIVAIMLDDGGKVTDARISLGAVAPTAIRILEAEQALIGKKLSVESADEICAIVQRSIKPISDIRASADYRRYMAGVSVKRQLLKCLEEQGL